MQQLRRNSTVLLYRQARDEITKMLENGSYAPGDRLPGETALAAQLGVNRLTIRRAVDELVLEGVLVSRRGSGTFVAEPRKLVPVTISLSHGQLNDHLKHELESRGQAYRDVLLSSAEDDDPEVRRDLDIPRSKICRIDSVLEVDGEPWMLSTSWVRARYTTNIIDQWHERVGPYAFLEKAFGNELRMVWRSFSAENASAKDAEVLDVLPGAALLVRTGLTADAGGTPVLRTHRRARGDRVRYVFHYPKEDQTTADLGTIVGGRHNGADQPRLREPLQAAGGRFRCITMQNAMHNPDKPDR